MARIPLIIADEDPDFLHSLSSYLLEDYGQTFDVLTFSQVEYLDDYLTEQARTGILLISPAMLQTETIMQPGLLRILLSNEAGQLEPKSRLGRANPECGQIFKYLSGPELVKSIMAILSESENCLSSVLSTSKKTSITAIYSPAGGVGKTTIALGCALQTAWEGKKVFYLNLEGSPSTGLFFEEVQGEGLATVLYYLQAKKENASLKIKALINTDLGSQIDYFAPTESGLELDEEGINALPELFNFLRNSCDYDLIYVDLGNEINTNFFRALDICDFILLINTPDPVCRLKVELFGAELKRWAARQKSTIIERVYSLWNKWEEVTPQEKELELNSLNRPNSFIGQELPVKIPLVQDLLLVQGNRYRLDLNGKFGTALYQVRANLQKQPGG